MQTIADQASVAVLNARLYTESQRTARVMSALAEGAASINSTLEIADVWRRVLDHTMQALQVETVALALNDSVSHDLVFQAAAGHNSGNIPGRHIPGGQGLVGMVATSGQGVIVPATSMNTLYNEVEKFSGVEMRALAIAPIKSQGKVIGVLEAINPIAGNFDPDALLVMSGLGSLAGTAIQNAQFLDRLQKAHERYRELFEDSIDPILITDWEGIILEANRHAVAISGYSAEILHKMSIDQLHEVKWSSVGLGFETLKRDEECDYESFLHRYNNAPIPVEVHARRVEFEETHCVQWIMRDITARKELDAMRDDMLAMIYHDLRSPLGNIVSSLEMIKNAFPADEEFHSILAIADHSTARIQRLINSLLDINRLESGQPVADQKSVDTLALIAETIRDVTPSAAGRQQRVENKAGAPLPHIFVDRDMIHRVLINLIENAIKFTPVESYIEIGAQPTSDGFVKFYVRDNGPGISPADAERIFDKFTRLRGKNKPGGLGIGLAFCRLAVRGHGGQIWVESEEDKGATFFLTLPIAP
jgi:PAS domain S-box-containing protein